MKNDLDLRSIDAAQQELHQRHPRIAATRAAEARLAEALSAAQDRQAAARVRLAEAEAQWQADLGAGRMAPLNATTVPLRRTGRGCRNARGRDD